MGSIVSTTLQSRKMKHRKSKHLSSAACNLVSGKAGNSLYGLKSWAVTYQIWNYHNISNNWKSIFSIIYLYIPLVILYENCKEKF